MTINAPQAAARIREALEPYDRALVAVRTATTDEFPELLRVLRDAAERLSMVCEPGHLRALLAERDELAKDAAAMREALEQIAEVFPSGWHKDDSTYVANSFIHQARAALTLKD